MVAPIRLMIVDDDTMIRESWKALVATTNDIVTVSALPNANSFVEQVLETRPDVVLLDLHMPGKNPLRALSQAISARPETRAVVYTALPDATLRQLAVQAGAWSYADKLDDPGEVIEELRRGARTPSRTL